LAVSVLPVIYIHFVYVWLAHIAYILEVVKESLENTKILRPHEAHIKVLLLHRSNTDETHTTKQCTNNYSTLVGNSCSGALHWGKIKICKNHQTLEASGDKKVVVKNPQLSNTDTNCSSQGHRTGFELDWIRWASDWMSIGLDLRWASDWIWIGLDPAYSKVCWIWIGSGL